MQSPGSFPIAIIGGGPVGLAAAAHASARGQGFVVLESGDSVAASVASWGHVRLFSPWRYNIDVQAHELLSGTSWVEPDPEAFPTGEELCERYLRPLAQTPELLPHIRLGARVVSVSRFGADKLKTAGREQLPFELTIEAKDGSRSTLLASAVIDASGTAQTPNPLGSAGVFALGEPEAQGRIFYGIPDVLLTLRQRYANKSVAVVGSGHSAFNALLDLVMLSDDAPGTKVYWVVRRSREDIMFGGGKNDALSARGELGARLRDLVARQRIEIIEKFRIAQVNQLGTRLWLESADHRTLPVDEIIASTGFRPDLTPLRELRLALDAAVEAPVELAPLIDPNEHSCGTVRPHGARELRHPERGFYIAGMKSYGRAPTFLMLTGYEQVRSIIAELAGDVEAAERVELVLPETGVCNTDRARSSCDTQSCAPSETESCSVPETACCA